MQLLGAGMLGNLILSHVPEKHRNSWIPMRYLFRMRAWLKPEIRDWLDGFGMVVAITLFFCLIQAAHDGIVNRNRQFDSQRWWYPIHTVLTGSSNQVSSQVSGGK